MFYRKEILLLLLLWAGVILYVNPVGEFPLNDDWAFSRPVQSLIEEGELRFSHWAMMSQLPQIFWGAAFCLPNGFSFTALRLSTLAIAVLASLFLLVVLRKRGIEPGKAILLTAAVFFHPITLNLSFTFMTEVPFMVCFLIAAWQFVVYLENENTQSLLLGILFTVFAFLIRQTGMVLPIAAIAAALLSSAGVSARRNLWLAATGIALLAFAWEWKLKYLLGFPADGRNALAEITWNFAQFKVMFLHLIKLLLKAALFAGLAFLPLFITRETFASRRLFSGLLFALAGTGILALTGDWFPFSFNIWMEGGTGPVALKEIYHGYPITFGLPPAVKIALTFLSFLGWFFLHWPPVTSGRRRKPLPGNAWLFLVFLAIGYLLLMTLRGPFDRYVLPVIAILPFVFMRSFPEGRIHPAGWIAAAAILLFSTGTVTEYLDWNRGRWQMLEAQRGKGVPVSKMDGGFEFNGYYGYDASLQPADGKSWWWVRDDSLVAGFRRLPGYFPVDSVDYRRSLPWQKGKIFLFARE